MNYILFTTTTCQKCPTFKKAVEESLRVPGRIITEKDEDFPLLVNEYTVSSVPTIIVFEDAAGHEAVLRTSEVSELLTFCAAHAH